ncbi:hypothetical protein P691DRAFT_663774 [Macrolepiota fuliginosa MF-IS2]|uniref:Uncharacterized protein n=1 Tax=Macrolepiota fuliginosa MF-IS2 TaxID=1400762 RepID=A0A9P5XKE5_9AGAR|nr:hypothetical protein P691DRAFT_663774 [Macrolepiota fuliginosa MF-IS2]
MKLTNIFPPIFAVLCATIVYAVKIPNADTPLFYLVASSSDQSNNLLSVRLATTGGGPATLLGSGPFPKWYFWQGSLVIVDPSGGSNPWRPLINTSLTGNGCSKSGALSFVLGSSTNKCAKYGSFQIQSFSENSQLGAKLVVDYTGGFYACGSNKDIYYKVSTNDGPSNCNPVDLYTVPVA